MTPKFKLLLTILVLAICGFGAYQWRNALFPAPSVVTQAPPSAPPAPGQAAAAVAPAQTVANKIDNAQEIISKLLAADKEAAAIGASAIPPVKGVSAYKLDKFNGKPLVVFPINVWPGWAPIIVANNGLEPNDQSLFTKLGFYVKLIIVDDPIKNRDLYASGQTPIMWATLDMVALFAPELAKDSRTIPNVPMQVDFSAGGDGVVAGGDIRSINDLKKVDGVKKRVIVAQNSPSHYFIMSLLLDAKIDPDDIDFVWASDAPSAAKIFVQDKTADAFVGFAPDIYTISDMDPTTHIVLSTASANRRIADVFAVRNDFVKDHPEIVQGLVQGILEGIDLVRKDPALAAEQLSAAYGIPIEDCKSMVGADGGIATGDAHLTNYRENSNFFFEPMNPANFEIIYSSAAGIFKALGAIDTIVPASQVKYTTALENLRETFKDSRDVSQPMFKPGMAFTSLEAPTNQILSRSVQFTFKPNSAELDSEYDSNINKYLDEIGKLAGGFGNAYIVIEGNTDASRRGVVPEDLVVKFSYDRADAVKKAILSKFSFPPDQFKVIGNGWKNPMPNSTDPTNPDHNKANRRVEVKVFPFESD